MTVAGLKQDDFIKLLNANGYETLSNEFWDVEGIKRIVMGKDGHTFTLRLRKFIFYPEVVYKFKSLELKNVPEELKDDVENCFKATSQLDWLLDRAKVKEKTPPEPGETP